MIRTLLLSCLFIIGCQGQSQSTPAATKASQDKAAVKAVPKTKKTNEEQSLHQGKKTKANRSKKTISKRAKKQIKWTDSLTWHSWSKAQEVSAETGRPIMLMIYAHWCPRCRELAPLFKEAKIVAAAEKLVLVRQDQDERPDWLGQYRDFGSYVPRIVFFGRDGQPRTDITSGRGKYPYFYTPRSIDALAKSMQKASAP